MLTKTFKSNVGVLSVNRLYETTKEKVEVILKRRYKMKARDAKQAIAISPLKRIFIQNPEMAAHTSNESWARQVYEYWKRQSL